MGGMAEAEQRIEELRSQIDYHNHRYHVLLKSPRLKEAHQMLKSAVTTFKPQSGVYLEIDVDPQALL